MTSEQKTALVTGSARGIGAGIVRALKSEGWYVIGCDLLELEKCQDSPVDQFIQANLVQPEDINRLCTTVNEKHKHLNALVNNAGVHWPLASLEDATLEQYDHIMSVNVRAPWLLTKECLPLLKAAGEGRASVVFTSSVNAMAGPMDASIYTASKGALNALTRQLAVELGTRSKIRVNAVMPGQTDTPLFRRHMARLADLPDPVTEPDKQTPATQSSLSSTVTQWAAPQAPLNRAGTGDDIGSVVAFLCDNGKAKWVTGQCLAADGGLLAVLVK